jgi:hypothetical protein
MPCNITETRNLRVTCLAGFNGKTLGEKQRVTTNMFLKQSSIMTSFHSGAVEDSGPLEAGDSSATP